MELEDFIASFSGKIEEPIGRKIVYFKYLFHEVNGVSEPVFAWMKTDDGIWHRFFMDVWIPYWEALNPEQALKYAKDAHEDSIEAHIKEEFKEYIDDEGGQWKVVDILELYNVHNKEILNVEVTYKKENDPTFAQLKLLIEEDVEILINDFCDITETELIINNNKIT
ncbi:hypothetical protein [Kordia sp.]|uniref:hypothetical protein n=1 Tax=Kordia sp. TaxID=1965332 RepID=UPI003D6BF9B7